MPRSHLDPLLPQDVILNALIRDTTAGRVALTVINHLLCIRCRGYQCSVNLRCEECENWSKVEMLVYEKILKSLTSKSIGSVNSSTKVAKKPASPPKTSADVDLDIGLRHNMVGCLKRWMIGCNSYLRLY